MDKYIVINLIWNCIYSTIFLLLICRKSQLNKNTAALEEISKRLGLNNDITLFKSVNDKFDNISADIGRADNSSLTKQHMNIEKSISHIQERFDKEDAVYHQFTMQQKDLKTTLDNFSRDYFELIKNGNDLYNKCLKLEQENEILINENNQLKARIQQLTSKKNNHTKYI